MTTRRYTKWQNSEFPLIQGNSATLPNGLITPVLSTGGNDFRQNFSSDDFIRLLSAIDAGSEMLYPDMQHYLTDIFLCGLLCPPNFPDEDGDCLTFTPYAPFVEFYPVSPYNEPNTIPNGFLTPPFLVNDGNSGLPPSYDVGDVVAFLNNIPLGDWTTSGWGLAGWRIDVYGAGQVEIDLIAVPQGGGCLIGVDSPPNYLNIIQSIFGLNENMHDLGLDLSSVPPETARIVKVEVDVDKPAGVKTEIYCTLIPTVDDQLIPVRYGGGIAANGIQLCGFEQGTIPMGITDVRTFNGQLQAFENGAWTDKGAVLENCNDVENCLSTSAIIGAIQQNVSDNIIDIATNTGDIATNATAIADIVGVNNNQQSQINANIIAIGGNTNDIADHETRLTTLENSSGGSGGNFDTKTFLLKEIIDTQSWTSDIASVVFDNISQDYDYLEIHFFGKAALTNDQHMRMLANDDNTASNYSYVTQGGAFNVPRIGYIGADDSGYSALPSPNIIRIHNYKDAVHKIADTTGVWSSGTSGASGRSLSQGWVWENNAAITKLVLELENGDFLANGYALLIGVLRQDVAVPAAAQELFFDFTSDDYDEIWTAQSGTTYTNARYQNDTQFFNDARITLNTSSDFNLIGVEVEYFIDDDDLVAPYVSWNDDNSNGEQDASPNINSVSLKVFSSDVDTDFLRIIVSNNNTTATVAGYAQILSVKLIISGAIPSELQPYT